MLSIKVDLRDVNKLFDELPNVTRKATVAALNRVATTARAEAVRGIAAETGLKQKDIRDHLAIRKADRFTLVAEIQAKPWSPNLIRYQARPTKRGVSAAPWKHRRIFKGTFIGNQGRTVFKRVGKARLPIKALHGPSVPREFMRGYALEAMRRKIGERFPLEFHSAFAQFMRTLK